MTLDLLNSQNYILINMDAIKIFGLNAATYLAELLNVYKKATLKKKLVDEDYFKVDRKFIFERTSLTIEDQLKIDINLMKIDVIKKHKEDPDLIKLDVNLYASIISSDDLKLIEDIRKKVKINSPRGVKETQRQAVCNNLKNGIVCSNYELLTALRDWVDAIYANPNNYLSKRNVEVFQNTLNEYTQGDLDVALAVVNIATAQAYRDCTWAINTYEKSKQYQSQNERFKDERIPRVTEQKKSSQSEIKIF